MIALKQEQLYTTDYIESLPEGERAELIDGVLYNMAPPNRKHQRISSQVHTAINNYIDSKKGSCQAYAAPFAVYLHQDDLTYVEPDISVICDPEKLNDKGCSGSPDWIIEITSKTTKQYDYSTKLAAYWNAGVREYWIINPLKNMVTVNYFADMDEYLPVNYTFQDKIKVNIYDDFTIDFSLLDL